MVVANNPAGRLHALVLKAKGLPQSAMGESVLKGWSTVLGLRPNVSRAEAVGAISQLYELPTQIAREIRELHGDDAATYLTWLPDVEAAFRSSNFDDQLAGMVNRFNPNVMALIAICNSQLRGVSLEPPADGHKLDALLKETRELIAAVLRSEIDGPTRDFILRQLYNVERGIIEYQFAGGRKLQMALEATVGAAVVNPDTFERAKSEPSAGAKLMKVLGSFVIICNAITGCESLATRATHFLQLPAPPNASSEGPHSPSANATATVVGEK